MIEMIDELLKNPEIPDAMRGILREEILHGIEVSNLAVMIAEELGKTKEEQDHIAVAGILHDLGKMQLTRYLYSDCADTLVVEQLKYVRMHSTFSYEMLKKAGYPENILQAVYHHHENYDGSGYPDNLRGTEIPWMARVLRTCDVFAALTSDRNYRKAFDIKSAVEIMIDEVGDYDMEVFLAFQRLLHGKDAVSSQSLQCRISPLQLEHIKMFEQEAVAEI